MFYFHNTINSEDKEFKKIFGNDIKGTYDVYKKISFISKDSLDIDNIIYYYFHKQHYIPTEMYHGSIVIKSDINFKIIESSIVNNKCTCFICEPLEDLMLKEYEVLTDDQLKESLLDIIYCFKDAENEIVNATIKYEIDYQAYIDYYNNTKRLKIVKDILLKRGYKNYLKQLIK